MQKTKTNEVARIIKFDKDNYQIIIDVPNIHDMQRPVHWLLILIWKIHPLLSVLLKIQGSPKSTNSEIKLWILAY